MTEKKKIRSNDVTLDVGGMVSSRWFVRLPDGLVADDLKDPDIWTLVVSQRQCTIRKHDAVYAVGYNDDFAVEARVVEANGHNIVLGKLSIISVPPRARALFNDDNYAVIWAGTGYAVQRKSDKVQMGPVFATEAKAIQQLQNQYPQAV